MEPQNQLLYQHFQQTLGEMKQRQTTLTNDIATVEEQLTNMKRELANLEISIISHQGGMSTIELLSSNNYAVVVGEQPIVLSQFPVTQQVQQYIQQPTQQPISSQPPITPQAQQTFAPQQFPSPLDIAASRDVVNGPQIVQGAPSTPTE